jgi:hypothetical protein
LFCSMQELPECVLKSGSGRVSRPSEHNDELSKARFGVSDVHTDGHERIQLDTIQRVRSKCDEWNVETC